MTIVQVFRKGVINMRDIIKRSVVLLAVLTFVAAPVFAMDSCPEGQDRDGHEGRISEKMRELNLTPEQEKLLKDTKEAHRAEMKKALESLKEKRQELKTALAKPNVTKQDVAPIAAGINALQAELVDRRIDGILKVKSILTPEQFAKLQDVKKDWHKGSDKKYDRKGCQR